jgi:two-component system CheB/CheR fusion protein
MPDIDAELSQTSSVADLHAEIACLRRRVSVEEAQNRVLLSSLRHRVRNALAVIRSVARRTAQNRETVADFQAHLDARLGAIARAQEMALRDADETVLLSELLAEELRAHAAREGDQFTLSGPRVRLGYGVAGPLSLAIHELATNAVKFGALSASSGRIEVVWRTRRAGSDQAIELSWRETGGMIPPPSDRQKGFGTEMVERTLPYELNATTSLTFGADGLECLIKLPISGIVVAELTEPES